jgi:hypothetical protein
MKEVKSDKELQYESPVQLVEQRFNSQAVWQGLAWDGEWEPLVNKYTHTHTVHHNNLLLSGFVMKHFEII